MPVFKDQTGKTISISDIPRRIISLVPSQTELLYDLGLDTEVVGITKFCVHPDEWFRTKKRVGGTKQLKMDIIHQIQPDLIIANKEENVKSQIEELSAGYSGEKHYPVWTSDVYNLNDANEMIEQIGLITDKKQQAGEMVIQIKENFSGLRTLNSRLRTCYLIWHKPYMTVGGDTFIHSMLKAAGFENVFSDRKRYPEVTIDELRIANCQLLLLSSEPFPFKEKHIVALKAQGIKAQMLLVDGEMFSWYGSRLLHAPAFFKQLYDQLK